MSNNSENGSHWEYVKKKLTESDDRWTQVGNSEKMNTAYSSSSARSTTSSSIKTKAGTRRPANETNVRNKLFDVFNKFRESVESIEDCRRKVQEAREDLRAPKMTKDLSHRDAVAKKIVKDGANLAVQYDHLDSLINRLKSSQPPLLK